MSVLTDREKREFKRTGFLVIPDAFESDLIEDWNDAVWDRVDVKSDADPFSYLDESDRQFWESVPWGPLERVTERTQRYAEALLGENNVNAPEDQAFQHTVRFADPETRRQEPSDGSGHIDGYGNGGYGKAVRGVSLTATTYLNRIGPRAGGFTVYPGSHWKLAEYWRSHDPLSFTDYMMEHGEPPIDAGDPFEITGDAGTLVLWHGRLLHTAGVNHTLHPRMAVFQRIRHRDYPDYQDDVLADPFMLWDGLNDIEIDDFSRPRCPAFRSD